MPAFYVIERDALKPDDPGVAVGYAGQRRKAAEAVALLWGNRRKDQPVIVECHTYTEVMRRIYAYNDEALKRDLSRHKAEFESVS